MKTWRIAPIHRIGITVVLALVAISVVIDVLAAANRACTGRKSRLLTDQLISPNNPS